MLIPRPLNGRHLQDCCLLLPGRTHRRHARGRSRGSCDSDSDENVVLSSGEEEGQSQNKKRRTGKTRLTQMRTHCGLVIRALELASPPPSHRKAAVVTPQAMSLPSTSRTH